MVLWLNIDANLLKYLLLGCPNNHVKELMSYESIPVFGWDISCEKVKSKDVKKCTNWNCPSSSKKTSYIKTKLVGTGRARLGFGNCNKNKKVKKIATSV